MPAEPSVDAPSVPTDDFFVDDGFDGASVSADVFVFDDDFDATSEPSDDFDVDDDFDDESADDADAPSDGSAYAMPGVPAMAIPTPSVTANAPTRPMYLP